MLSSIRETYTCPYCDLQNLSERNLCKHVLTSHTRDPKPVVSDSSRNNQRI